MTCLGKIIGGGLPAAAYGGRKEIMNCITPEGAVYQAGTLSGNPLAVTAGIETLKQIKAINAKIQVVLFTGHGSEETRRLAEVMGAFSYVDKIDGLPKLAPMIEGAFRLRKVLEDTYADAAMNEDT